MAEFRKGDVIISVDHSLNDGEVAFLQYMTIVLDGALQSKTLNLFCVFFINAVGLYGKAVKILKEKG